MQVEDVTDDGKVVTKLVRKGKDYKRPNEGATVKVAYTGRIGGPNGPVFEEHSKESPLEFVTDEGEHFCRAGLERACSATTRALSMVLLCCAMEGSRR